MRCRVLGFVLDVARAGTPGIAFLPENKVPVAEYGERYDRNKHPIVRATEVPPLELTPKTIAEISRTQPDTKPIRKKAYTIIASMIQLCGVGREGCGDRGLLT